MLPAVVLKFAISGEDEVILTLLVKYRASTTGNVPLSSALWKADPEGYGPAIKPRRKRRRGEPLAEQPSAWAGPAKRPQRSKKPKGPGSAAARKAKLATTLSASKINSKPSLTKGEKLAGLERAKQSSQSLLTSAKPSKLPKGALG